MSEGNKKLRRSYNRNSTSATPPGSPLQVSQKSSSLTPCQNGHSYCQSAKEDNTHKRKRSISPTVSLRTSVHDETLNINITLNVNTSSPHVPSKVPVTPPTREEQIQQIKDILKQDHEPSSLNMYSPREAVQTVSQLHLQRNFPVSQICSAICSLSLVPTQVISLKNRYEKYENDPNSDPLPWRGVKVQNLLASTA